VVATEHKTRVCPDDSTIIPKTRVGPFNTST